MMRVFFRIIAGFLSAFSFVLFGSVFWRFDASGTFTLLLITSWLVA